MKKISSNLRATSCGPKKIVGDLPLERCCRLAFSRTPLAIVPARAVWKLVNRSSGILLQLHAGDLQTNRGSMKLEGLSLQACCKEKNEL